ncbi:hypothetical protein GC176_26455 [bacterium]|nr:hypothetical protein [bacterium]
MPLRIVSNWAATVCALLSAAALLFASGCGGGGSTDEAVSSNGDSATAATSGKSSSTSSKSGGATSDSGSGRSGPKTIDGIPYDVFFDRPLEVAADSRTGGTAPAIAATTTGGTPAAAATEPAADNAAKPEAEDVSWSKLIPAEMLNEEVRFLRNEIQSRLTNMGAYKKSVLELPVFGSALAYFAEIASRHDGDISWKANAKYIRALGSKIAVVTSGSDAQTKNSYEEVNNAYLTINEILNNNTPAELPEVEDEAPDFSEVADMFYLMKRMERGQQWMQTNTGSESGFNDKAATLAREVAVMVALTQAYYAPGYGYADDEEFLGYLNKLRDAGLGMRKAVEEKDFAKYDELRSAAGQQCTQCHSVFKNG